MSGKPCPQCGEDAPPVCDDASGDHICTNCGVVLVERNIDEGAEWRTFQDDTETEKNAKNRAGTRVNRYLNNGGIETTYIANRALNRANQIVQGDENKALRTMFDIITRIQDDLRFSDAARDTAFDIASVVPRKALRSRTSDACTLIYLACREEDEGRTLKEIASAVTDASIADISRAYLRMEKIIPARMNEALQNEILPEKFLTRFVSRLGLSMDIEKVARVICQEPAIQHKGNKQHAVVALAVLYLVAWMSNIDLSLSTLAPVGNLGENTLQDCINGLRGMIDDYLPKSFKKMRYTKDLPRILK